MYIKTPETSLNVPSVYSFGRVYDYSVLFLVVRRESSVPFNSYISILEHPFDRELGVPLFFKSGRVPLQYGSSADFSSPF